VGHVYPALALAVAASSLQQDVSRARKMSDARTIF
jgi:hypothetical protein